MATLGYKKKFHSKKLAEPCIFREEFRCCNLELPYTFWDSLGSPEYCSAFGFLVTWGSLPYRSFPDAVNVAIR